MTPRKGDRVHVEYDGVVRAVLSSGRVMIAADGYENRPGAIAWPDAVTVLAPAPKVGDVIDADTPEPPTNAVLIDERGSTLKRVLAGWVYASAYSHAFTWADIVRFHGDRALKVAWLP